ncbi:PRC-barrel domain-containing protein [Rhodoblastus acidophilus]|uniref:PRC-barrel domain-containing protein n=1 Tax=Candidatus Rhodoblastus alkanivorans TaxID=2954117 RepID=A0ABS9Z7Q7_9HYPH|nr:PRC-barrel domain-containing protein [Candidatus Rhodoblastus alkanivorans]MCI4678932.1 PRC-barrel domain-containing protein [Candidatus Rhodoblastus alkanivorans]MCI4683710.1 PRC-barrel domain-containing protein [Candidatus Rhodoblastus alkanivorans]MDI4641027.1 PRC-barrel domain-containing protein [Rhodoblastus acidophilus]
MLKLGSTLKGYAIEASDGAIGSISDFLFDDRTWLVRWLVVDTGNWLTGRKVLLLPTALGKAEHDRRELPAALTRAQVEASPELSEHEPVSTQMERHLYDYYNWEPIVGDSYFSENPIASRFSAPPLFGSPPAAGTPAISRDDSDPHLRSVAAIAGYHILASDGAIGKVGDLLIDDDGWGIRFLVVDTGNWWSGEHVLISPHAVKEISWAEREIRLNVSRDQVRSSPPWSPLGDIDPVYEADLRKHYDWPGRS